MIAHRKTKTTKSNTLMAFVDVEDLYGQVEVIVFPASSARAAPCWRRPPWCASGVG